MGRYFQTEGGQKTGVFVRRERIQLVDGRPCGGKEMSEVLDDISPLEMHGRVVKDGLADDWKDPICVVECSKDARPGYNSMPAHEYEDDFETLEKKVEVLAQLIIASKKCCIYSGAGLSTSSGINDYASKAGAKSKIQTNRKKAKNNKSALPNIGHRTFAQLALQGQIENWVQQNHDGLPQKAGFPQHRINEIHGSWYDASNPVVPMKGTLRSDLFDWLETIVEESDLTIAVGTSLCGMSADDVFCEACNRYKKKKGFGGVIIGLQQTQYDAEATLRIFSRIATVVALLARKMNLILPPLQMPIKLDLPKNSKVGEYVYRVPYDSDGDRTEDESEMILWDLTPGTRVRVTDGPGKGFEGLVFDFRNDCYWSISLPNQRQGSSEFGKGKKLYSVGIWWVETATKGLWPKLPVVNTGKYLKKWNGDRTI